MHTVHQIFVRRMANRKRLHLCALCTSRYMYTQKFPHRRTCNAIPRSSYDREDVIARKEKEEEGEEYTEERMRPSGTIARDATRHEESFLPPEHCETFRTKIFTCKVSIRRGNIIVMQQSCFKL